MTDELGVYLPAAESGVNARRAKNILNHLLSALDALAGVSDDWTFTELRLGSLDLAVAPAPTLSEPRRTRLQRAEIGFIDGLSTAAADAVMPPGWTQAAARASLSLLRQLGPNDDARIFLRRHGDVVRSIAVDETVISGLERALSGQIRGFGSVTGHLRELDDGQNVLTARLIRPDGREVVVEYRPGQADEIRRAWRHHRVEVTGRTTLDSTGEPTRIHMESLEMLPEQVDVRLPDVAGGFYEGITGGLPVRDYLRLIRGE